MSAGVSYAYLLKIYTRKLRTLTAKLGGITQQQASLQDKANLHGGHLSREEFDQQMDLQRESQRLGDLWRKLHPPLRRLAQSVSQQIEGSALDPIESIELSLRLPEFEHQLLLTEDAFRLQGYS
jgi:hypothetical protein